MTVFDVIFVLLLCVCILCHNAGPKPSAGGRRLFHHLDAVLALGAVAGMFVFIIANSSKSGAA
jgi:hypothetical protein